MKKYDWRENYSKEIEYYLEEKEKKPCYIISLYEDDKFLNQNEINKKYEKIKEIDDLKDKIKFVYFDNNFKSKARKIIKTFDKKIFLLNFINNIFY